MSQTKHIPEKGVMCHRAGFAKSCRECVVEHGCQLWVRLSGRDKDTDGPIDLYGCADSFGPQIATQGYAQLTRSLEMVAKGVDHLRIEVQGGNVKAMLAGINELNSRVADAQQLGHRDPIKLLSGSGGAN